MDEMDLVLTAREVEMVLAERARVAEAQKANARVIELLRVAYEYKRWLSSNNVGTSFSTFCDDYKYPGTDDYPRDAMYRNVMEVIKLAMSLLGD